MIYDIEAPDGRIFSIEGDEPPTAQEVELLFSSSIGLDDGLETATEPRPDLSTHDIYDTLQSGINLREKLSMVFNDKEASMVEKIRDLQTIAAQETSGLRPKEHLKTLGRESGRSISLWGKVLKMSGEQVNAMPINPIEMTGIHISKKDFGGLLTSVGELIEKGGDAIADSKLLEMDEDYKREVHSGTFLENPSLARTVDVVMGAIPSMATGYGVGMATKSTKLAALALSYQDSVSLYEEARESGKSVEEATLIFGAGAAGTYFLEKYGLDEFFNNTVGRSAIAVFKKMGAEGLTETGQTLWQNLVAKVGYDEARSIWEGCIESFIGGSLGAGIFHPISSKRYNANKKKLTDAGYSEEQADKIMNGIALEVSEHKEVVNKHFENNIKKFVEQGEAELAKMDENKFYQFKKEAHEVEAKILNDMKLDEAGFTDEEIYSISDVISSQVYSLALMQGTTPANIKLPEIVLQQNAKFLEDLKNKKANLQTAFYGSRVDHDKPSLEAIGSGEGQQVHGWGLYYALKRAVAESYREKFINELKGVDALKTFTVDGKPFLSVYKIEPTEKVVELLKDAHQSGKDGKLLSYLESKINQFESFKEKGGNDRGLAETYKRLYDDISSNGSRIVTQGQVHEVDIPDYPYLLDEDLSYNQQPEIVKTAINNIINELTDEQMVEVTLDPRETTEEKREYLRKALTIEGEGYDIDVHADGKGIYKALSKMLGSDKAASQMLEKHGVKGISYYGREDGYCFVVFNPNDVKVIDKLYKSTVNAQGQKGAYIDGKIYLFEGADVSTVMHEFMHHWQDQMRLMGTKKSQEILARIDEWSTAELGRKYDVKAVGNKFKVVDKKGNTVYNNLGRNFATEAEATEYAKDELFAQGFEQYLSTGKAPNKTLETAFGAFFNYMKKIFGQTKALDIELTAEMKQVYADMLGGASIDTFRNKSFEEFVKERNEAQVAQREELNRIEEAAGSTQVIRFQEDIKNTDSVISKALDKFKDGETSKDKKNRSKLLKKMIMSLSTRAKNIHPHLNTILTRYFSDINVKTERRLQDVKGFLDGINKIKKADAEDYARMDLAIKNNDIETMLEIAEQYDFSADLNVVRDVLDELYNEAEKYGLKVDFRSDYFPRTVKDYKGLNEYFTGKEFSAVAASIEKVEKALERPMTEQEVADHINLNLRRIANTDIISKTNHRKGRTLETIDETVSKYFDNSDTALVNYIENMTRHIEAAKILGVNKEQSKESVGHLVNELYKKGEIKRSKLDETQDLIHAALDTSGITYSTLKVIRDTGYLVSMGNFTTAIAQLDDFASVMTNAGFLNAIKAIFSRSGVTISDIGINSIGEEFRNPDKLGGLVTSLFKSVGLTKVDNFIKNTFIEADNLRMKQMKTEDLANEIAVLFYDNMEKATQVAKDIQAGKKTEDTLFVYYSNLSKYQPISRFEMPEYYRGNARIFYTLKSFMLKRIDTALDDIRTVLFSKKSTPLQRKNAGWHLVKWIFALSACGLSKELLIDLLLGRKIDIKDSVINTMLGYIGMNKYYLYRAESYGVGDAVNSIVFGFPIINFANIIQKDFKALVKDKKDFGDLDSWKFVPYIGKLYYERLGGGKDKAKGRKKKNDKKFY